MTLGWKSLLGGLTSLLFTLWLGSIVIFIISKNVQVDKVEQQLTLEGINAESTQDYQKFYQKKYQQLQENLPLFYFEILPSGHCPNKRQFADFSIRKSIEEAEKAGFDCSALSGISRLEDVKLLHKINYSYPVVRWMGFNNQYHIYLSSLLSGNWGVSSRDGTPVWTKIAGALKWTLSVIAINLILALVFSIVLAVWLWKNKIAWLDKIVQSSLHALYSVPGFWLATLVLIFFTGPQYGMPIFYTPLYISSAGESWSLFLGKIAPVVFCLTLQDIALLTRLIRSKLDLVFKETFMGVLISRGSSENTLIIKHALPNALLPLVTLLFNSLPASIAGSLVFEVVFNIPGMGRLLSDSIRAADWSVVYGICLMTLCITVLVYAVGDIVYKRVDPRIR